uniref:Coiled-coil domain containing 125 n=1 Tax=Cynoglossus semilaevis TaxID=244447 RepID=A0A3P8VIF3_CYNSE
MSVEENQTPGTSVVPVKVSKQPQMQGLSLEDDMVDGDLGDGTELRKTHSSSSRKTQSLGGLTEGTLSQTKLGCCNSEEAMAWISKSQQKASWKIPHCGSLNDLSKDELKDRLRQASEVIDMLCCELEVAHRYLEGKYQALKILQGKAILDKATTHTKSLLLKSDERAKALEKEVNSLQWELSFSQLQMKKAEQSWEQKYNGLLTENKTLINSLQERESEFQELRAENSALGRQCLELLSMLNLREQRVYEGSKPQYSPERNTSVLELAVLGACRCPGVVESCPCSRAAAASRKRLIKLQQELEAQRYRREEALMVADAFRIAFEQQLRKRN